MGNDSSASSENGGEGRINSIRSFPSIDRMFPPAVSIPPARVPVRPGGLENSGGVSLEDSKPRGAPILEAPMYSSRDARLQIYCAVLQALTQASVHDGGYAPSDPVRLAKEAAQRADVAWQEWERLQSTLPSESVEG